MKTKWKGGILLPAPGKNAYGHYEILGDDDAVIGHLVVENNGGPGKPFKVGITTDREIDLDSTSLAFVEDEDPPGIVTVTPTRPILTAQEREEFAVLQSRANDVAQGMERWMQDHLASAFPEDEDG